MSAAEISPQLTLFLVSVACGFVMGAVYDIIRIFRRMLPHAAVMMFAEDIVFWLFSAAVVFCVMLCISRGEVRFFAIGGFFGGMTMYFCTLSIVIIKLSEAIISLCRKIIVKLFAIIAIPFKILHKILLFTMRPLNAIYTKFNKLLQNLLKKIGMCAKIILSRVSHSDGRKKKHGGRKKDER